MSPTVLFLALCILGIDFMIYALLQWTYGDKRRELARQLAAHKNALKKQSHGPFLAASQKATLGPQERPRPSGEHVATREPRDPGPRGSSKERVA
jgi:hypothetical protein